MSSLPPKFIEKQEMVVKVLDKLFTDVEGLIFKGGTSLSMVYDLTKRFSEDIDIASDNEVSKKDKLIQQQLINVVESIKGMDFISDYTMFDVSGNEVDDVLKLVTIELHYVSSAEKSAFDMSIRPGVVLLEPQVQQRGKSITIHEHTSSNGVKWNVQSIESTLAEKISLLVEEIILKGDFTKWLSDPRRSNPRHFYDLYMIINKIGINPNIETFNKRFENVWNRQTCQMKPKAAHIKLFTDSYRNWKDFIIMKNQLLDEVKSNMNKWNEFIEQSLDKLIYPKVERININKIMKVFYECADYYFDHNWKSSLEDKKKHVKNS